MIYETYKIVGIANTQWREFISYNYINVYVNTIVY